jgi:site-specific recombinase XerD
MVQLPLPSPIIDTIDNLNAVLLTCPPSFAKNDLSSVIEFLKQYNGNLATFEAYRREIERLLQWAWLVSKKSILELKRQDIQEYIEFCLDPPLSWIGTIRVPRFLERGGIRQANPRWRPFVATISKQDYKSGKKPEKNKYRLSQKATQEIFTVLSSFYNFLLLEEKVPLNPIALIRQKSRYIQKQQTKMAIKRLTETQWQHCLKIAKQLASDEPEQHERTLFYHLCTLSSLFAYFRARCK